MDKRSEEAVKALAETIRDAHPGGEPIAETLSTSDKVLRRVTDGIYREPWSALRELVSNAYDADATEVTIDTDAPRFGQITIRDNGLGFTSESLAAMIKSIGGSMKRTVAGGAVGVTSLNDPELSPGGRKLIGKLGIGLFAVSQLTHEFQIITKRRGTNERTIADVILFRYSESSTKTGKSAPDEEFATGSVRIWKVPAPDKKSQGTEIILRNLLPRTKAELASEDIWTLIHAPTTGDEEVRAKPIYHIGYVDPRAPDEFVEEPVFPWGPEGDPDKRFERFTESMFSRAGEAETRKPSLENTFDNYLRFLWLLSLAAPLDYLGQHPFDLESDSGIRVFRVGNTTSDSAEELKLKAGQSIRSALRLKSPERGANGAFRVVVDGVALRRPIRFKGLPKSRHAVDRPLLFVGHDRPNLSKFAPEVRGGDLEFEAYLLWTPRVIPIEHTGVLVRVNDASGTLFDETFMQYQISEQVRLKQVSSEIFVTEGLDAALNIDRESFNVAHPHYQYLSRWVHSAFRQFATRHKSISGVARTHRLVSEATKSQTQLTGVVEDIVDQWTDGDESPVVVAFNSKGAVPPSLERNAVAYDVDIILANYNLGDKATAKKAVEYEEAQAIMRAIAQVLYSASVFERMSHSKQQRLLADLAKIIFFRKTV